MPSALVNTSTDNDTLVAAPPADSFIRVHGLNLTADGQVYIELFSESTLKWHTYATNDANVKGGIVLPIAPADAGSWFDCAKGEALKIGLSGAVNVAGTIVYSVRK